MDQDNDLLGFADLEPGGNLWIGELSHEEGAFLDGAILIGPVTGDDPLSRKKWEHLKLHGEGRARVFLWVDNRLVSQGMLSLAEGPDAPNKLNIPKGLGTGFELLALIIFQGVYLGAEIFFDRLGGTE